MMAKAQLVGIQVVAQAGNLKVPEAWQEVQLAIVTEVVKGAEQATVQATAEDARAAVLDASDAMDAMAAAWVATGAGMVGGTQATAQAGDWRVVGAASQEVRLAMTAGVVRGAEQLVARSVVVVPRAPTLLVMALVLALLAVKVMH